MNSVLFIIVLEALSQEFHTCYPWEHLYDNDLVPLADTMDELLSKRETKGLRVNIGKTKVINSRTHLHSLRNSGKHPYASCHKGVGSNSVFCTGCQL